MRNDREISQILIPTLVGEIHCYRHWDECPQEYSHYDFNSVITQAEEFIRRMRMLLEEKTFSTQQFNAVMIDGRSKKRIFGGMGVGPFVTHNTFDTWTRALEPLRKVEFSQKENIPLAVQIYLGASVESIMEDIRRIV